jgi:hypothetical protein
MVREGNVQYPFRFVLRLRRSVGRAGQFDPI